MRLGGDASPSHKTQIGKGTVAPGGMAALAWGKMNEIGSKSRTTMGAMVTASVLLVKAELAANPTLW
jgi:hypothetical protein